MFLSQGHESAPLALTPAQDVAAQGAAPADPSAPKKAAKAARKTGRADAAPYKEGLNWCIRSRYRGHDIYVSNCESPAKAKKAAAKRRQDIDAKRIPAGLGPHRTTVAQALQDYARDNLPFMKGAVQEALRINRYLRDAGLQTLVVGPCHDTAESEGGDADEEGRGAYFEVTLEAHTLERTIPNGLAAHRKAQLTKTGRTENHRAVLAGTVMSEVTREQLQRYVYAMRRDRCAPATIALHRSIFRVLFNHAFSVWRWSDLVDNPATRLKMPVVNNTRKRVLSLREQVLLDAALQDCRNKLAAPVITLLRETAMRVSEPLQHAKWRDVDWTRCVLSLNDGKTGQREVPLSPVALQVLRDLGPGLPEAPIVEISYDALKKAMERACERAGINDLDLRDMRRTGATRLGLKTGNLFLVKALTGHKTTVMAQRYMQVEADDVVKVLHAQEEPPAADAAVAPVSQAVVACTPQAPAQVMQTPLTMTESQLEDVAARVAARVVAGMSGGAPIVSQAVVAAAVPRPLGTGPSKGGQVLQFPRAA